MSEISDFQGPLLTGDFASEEVTNEQVARAMTNLSPEERVRALEDVHGVSHDLEETPALLERSLASFEEELGKLKDNNQALCMAIATDNAYVQNKIFRLQFLRADSFDAKAAAQRFSRHFHQKLQLFGEEKLTKDIVQDDLDEETMDILYAGRFQNLPLRDKSGRHVSLYMLALSKPRSMPPNPICLMRRIFYSAMVNVESVETQRKGVVIVVWGIAGERLRSTISAGIFWGATTVGKALPVKTIALHFCYDNVILRPVLSTIQFGFDYFTGVRVRSHYGNHVECLHALQSFGIPANLIPLNSEGNVTSKDYHVAQMEQRRRHERRQFESRTVMIPGSFDILVGKGKPFQDHPGNTELRDLIRRHRSSYEMAQKYEKKNLVLQVIEMVHHRGGRFLRDDGGHWMEVDEDVARAKVGHLFRDKKRQREPKASAAAANNKARSIKEQKASPAAANKAMPMKET